MATTVATPDLITTGEAAARLGVTRMTVTRWCDVGMLRHVRLPGGARRVDPEDVAKLAATLRIPSRT